jgi:hypothetical protein
MPLLKYNGISFAPVSAGVEFPFPFISKSQSASFDSGQEVINDTYTINGSFYIKTMTAGGAAQPNVTQLNASQGVIIDYFSKNNKELVTDFGTHQTVKVRSIDFDPSFYGGLMNYSIVLEAASERAAGAGGPNVVDVVDEFTISENDNGQNTISHRVSAKGLESSNASESAALANAITWVNAKLWGQMPQFTTGVSNTFISPSMGGNYPFSGGGFTGDHPSLVMINLSEQINRMSATYSITETYEYVDAMWAEETDQENVTDSGQGMLTKYAFETDWDSERFCATLRVTVNVRVSTTDNIDLKNVKNYLASQLGGTGISAGVLAKVKGMASANVAFKDESIASMHVYRNSLANASVDLDAGTITLSFAFDNDARMNGVAGTSNVFFDYQISISTDWMSGKTTASMTGKLLTDPTLSIEEKNTIIDSWFNTHKGTLLHSYLYNLIIDEYDEALTANIAHLQSAGSYSYAPIYPAAVSKYTRLNPIPQSLNASADQSSGGANIAVTFTDEDYVPGIKKTQYNVNYTPSIVPFEPKASVVSTLARDGHYIIFNPGGLRRTKWSANVQMESTPEYTINPNVFNTIEQRLKNILNSGGTDKIKEEDTLTHVFENSTDARSSFAFSLMKPNFWSISQQVYPPVGVTTSYNMASLANSVNAYQDAKIDFMNQINSM